MGGPRSLLALVLVVAVASCTRDHSLGAAGAPDGGFDARFDVEPDAPPDACAGGGCSGDGSVDDTGDTTSRRQVAAIVVSSSDRSPEIDVVVWDDASAERTIADGPATAIQPLSYAPRSPDVLLFLSFLQASGDITSVGSPSPSFDPLCTKAPFIGTTTKVTMNAAVSGDLECLLNVTEAQNMMAYYSQVLAGRTGTVAEADHLCLFTGGQIASNLCCSADDFPTMCAVGSCTCAPSVSTRVYTCACPNGGCFQPLVGCEGPEGVCTVGADQTCNDNPTIDSLHGHCATGGRCICGTTFPSVAASGKCL